MQRKPCLIKDAPDYLLEAAKAVERGDDDGSKFDDVLDKFAADIKNEDLDSFIIDILEMDASFYPVVQGKDIMLTVLRPIR